jgi:hypothetical protein
VLDEYEQMCLSQATRSRPGRGAPEPTLTLADRLAAEEERLAMEAKLPWIEFARRALRTAADRDRDRGRPNGSA